MANQDHLTQQEVISLAANIQYHQEMNLKLQTPSPEHGKLSGMLLAGTAFALLSSVDTIFKLMATGHPIYQIIFINGVFALVPVVLWACLTGGTKRLQTTRPLQHLLRGAIAVFSAFCSVFAYSRLPLPDFYSIVFVGPLTVTTLSAFWLKEQVDWTRWTAIILGFIAIFLTVNPLDASLTPKFEHTSYMIGRLAALAGVTCYSLSVLLVRRMRTGETNLTFSFYGYLSALIITSIFWIIKGAPDLTINHIMHLALSGTLAGVASICLMTAYHRTPAALIAPFQYTQLAWGILAGYVFWDHLPTLRLLIGSSVVITCGLFVIYREIKNRDPLTPSPKIPRNAQIQPNSSQ
jgi:drug/metabolite transporter (DMT)-like permease